MEEYADGCEAANRDLIRNMQKERKQLRSLIPIAKPITAIATTQAEVELADAEMQCDPNSHS